MKYYVEFYKNKQRVLGMDGTRLLDGRLSLFNLKLESFTIAKNLKKIIRFDSFKVFKVNSLLDSPIYLTDKIDLHYETSHYLK